MSKKRYLLMAILSLVAQPAVLHAVDMGGMGMGMPGMLDKVYLQTKTVGKVVFSHAFHGAGCNDCHPKLFIKKSNSNHVTMKAMESGKSCGGCHNGKKAFSVTANCTTCHAGDILFPEKETGNVTFSHAAHIEAFGCGECHPGLFKAERGANKATMADMEKGKSCGACHDGSTAFNVAEACESCHKM